MITTFEDATLLFGRWKEEAPTLRVKLMSNSLIFEAAGTLTDFTIQALQLSGPAWQFTIPLAGAQYTFSDPREIAVQSVRETESAKYEFGLALELPNGDRLVLLELKKPDESEGELPAE
jgi:hypothetical protein